MCVQHYQDTEDPLTSATAKSMDEHGRGVILDIYYCMKYIIEKLF